MNKKGFVLQESLLLFIGAVLICVLLLSSMNSEQRFEALKGKFDFISEDERLKALYE